MAPNGRGKSIILRGCSAAAQGKGRLPLRDHARKGFLSAFGAVIAIGATSRHQGEFEVSHLEGAFDISKLVDPGIKDPIAADRARIKALVQISGASADRERFLVDDVFQDWDDVVGPDFESSDLVEMAAKVKRDYETAARKAEGEAEKRFAASTALMARTEGINLEAESNSNKLQFAYDRARETLYKLSADQNASIKQADERARLAVGLDNAVRNYTGPSGDVARASHQAAVEAQNELAREVERLKALLSAAQSELAVAASCTAAAAREVQQALQHEMFVKTTQDALASMEVTTCPSDAEIEDATVQVRASHAAIEDGVRVRDAQLATSQAAEERAQGLQARRRAESYRTAANATDDVLSAAIECPWLRVDSHGGDTRLVTDRSPRGDCIPYGELSDGERWRIGTEIGADRVGEGGLLVLPQEAWEGLDVYMRPLIDQYAAARGIYILTAEATRDERDGTEFVTRSFGEEQQHGAND